MLLEARVLSAWASKAGAIISRRVEYLFEFALVVAD